MTKFDQIYQGLVKEIMTEGLVEFSERTGYETRAIPGLHFRIDIEKDGFPLLTLRRIPIKAPVAE